MDLTGSNWIYIAGEERPTNLYVLFRRSISVSDTATSAKVCISADAFYKLYVNGEWIGRGPVRSSGVRKYYDEYDILPYLQKGENVVAAITYMHGVPCFEALQVRGGLVAKVEVVGAHGTTVAATDRNWRVQRGTAWRQNSMRISHARGFSEYYDARVEPTGWMLPGFDDSNWEQAVEIAPAGQAPWPPLVPRTIPMQVYSTAMPVSVVRLGGVTTKPKDNIPADVQTDYGAGRIMCTDAWGPLQGVTVTHADALLRNNAEVCTITPRAGAAPDVSFMLDFGGEVNGYPYFTIEAPAGTVIDIAWAETLGPTGELDHLYKKMILRGAYGAGIVLPGGTYRWESYQMAGLRYMQVVVRSVSAPVKLHQVGVHTSAFNVPAQASFACSDPMLTKLFVLGRNALLHCMDDSYLDCPQRERGQWLADAVVEGIVAAHLFGDSALWRKALSDFGESQTPDGKIISVYPSEWERWIPGFACIWVHGLRRYAELTGDYTLAPEMLPAVEKLILHLGAYEQDGLLRSVQGWLFFDWQSALPEECVTLMNLSYYLLLRDAAVLAESCGNTVEAGKWTSKATMWAREATALKQTIWEQCWDEEKGLLRDVPDGPTYSEQTNGFALYVEALPDTAAKRVVEYLTTDDNGLIRVATPYFAFWVLTPLMDVEREWTWKRVRTDWGRMVESGDNTTWEHFARRASLCHGWSSGPSLWMLTDVLGIKMVEPSFRKVMIRPYLGELSWASGVMPTPHGYLSVYAKRNEDGSVTVDVTAPADVEWEVAQG